MVPSFRKFIGMVGLVVFVIVYAFVAMVIGDLKLQNANGWVTFGYYAFAGLIWVIPAGAIISWMERPSRNKS
ncbi:uncharacterized protein DUF2842 [Roseibium hamelinense]|uniref:Uncharacterized protein DUF2842 n=1 Tax=Roseibium hamelinense TaxID=150831 RepID=A0A562TGB8_9HYPH|nr:DUF2842 domain-containing protein [Roseibium hamelinense]MTI46171.1 DUF2842 domain-containing protein [Roseibium hamelinense]TWI92637.1 uncharacterized protein DUF2842 [Roseibium hamelinense]